MWWSWHDESRQLFRVLDYPLWRSTGHNPVKQLIEMSPEKLQRAADDPNFLKMYDAVMALFDAEMSATDTWFATKYPERKNETIAYFSAEFAIHRTLPIYAGGLGVLAGDLCKEASDLGLPMVAVGFMYPQGYFRQHISAEGWQEESYEYLDFREAPINPCPNPQAKACGPLIQLQLADRPLYIGAWLVSVGRTSLYLLDTDVEGNLPADRQLSARLYTADREQRIQQEIALGIGGVRVLRALGINPSVWHTNEGHTSFMTLERIREEVAKGTTFSEAVRRVQNTTVFTTHTPVPAGHDIFSTQLIDKYFYDYWNSLGIDRQTFLELGQHEGPAGQGFNMTVLGLKMANWRNGVSQLHGGVARKMWQVLWPKLKENKVPISHITNGVHVPTWITPEVYRLCEKHIGTDFLKRQDDPELWRCILSAPDEEYWEVHQTLKRKLLHVILERAQEQWAAGKVNAQQVLAIGALLDLDVLTIAFARRFTEYKRPALIFSDLERLKRIVKDKQRPVQIIFAGKSHPADFPSKYLLHQVYTLATDREFQGRIAFVEDYDVHLARYLAHGVDIWLNTPRRLQEACGTSGMKAALNGVLNLSVRDGWWDEGYNGKNGWAIGEGVQTLDPAVEDKADAGSIYDLLENKIVPLYYDRDRNGVPHGWMQTVKEAIASLAPAFSARRMVKEYTERTYLPALQSLEDGKAEATSPR